MFTTIPFQIKLVLIIGLIVGFGWYCYSKGAAHAEAELADYKAKAEQQISDLKDENIRISDNVTIQYVDRTKVIKEKEIIYQQATDKLEPQYDLSNGWIELHDASAKLANPDATLASDNSPSGVMDNKALSVVLSNYAICHENREKLVNLQQWVRDTMNAVEESNKRILDK